MSHVLAIIGASSGQRPVYLKARELGFRTIGFAWEEGALCRDLADRFYPISITDTDRIVDICRREGVSGVVSNGSDFTAEAVSKISSSLGLPGVPYDSFLTIKDKFTVRELTSEIPGLSSPWSYLYEGQNPPSFPCVVKPCVGSAKKGVCYAADTAGFQAAIQYAREHAEGSILVEEYIHGQEVSVESLSFRGRHDIVQITDKDTSGPPHFVEIGHHQPSRIPAAAQNQIIDIVKRLLTLLHYDYGASHIELKLSADGKVFLIEMNPRGGGDEIANQLVPLSTGVDYIASIIQVAVGQYESPEIRTVAYAGIYYLCGQTAHLLPFFAHADGKPWLVNKVILDGTIGEATTNYNRNGYLIYASDHRVTATD